MAYSDIIWQRTTNRNIKPSDTIKSMRNLHGFLTMNSLPDRIFKSQGGYYMLDKEGIMYKIFHSLYSITFEELWDILSKRQYEENMPRIS